MAKIRNSSMKNWYGEGNQKIFTDNSGKEYIIRNSAMDNWYGDGKQIIVEEKNNRNNIIAAGNTILITIATICLIGAVISIINGLSFTAPCMIVMFICIFLDVILGFFKF